ncbi:MAG: hypothetical protein HY602_00270 [Parcubacteria group bacterium]|nr:hypothetical protein [Parcubacteria group bacterium]
MEQTNATPKPTFLARMTGISVAIAWKRLFLFLLICAALAGLAYSAMKCPAYITAFSATGLSILCLIYAVHKNVEIFFGLSFILTVVFLISGFFLLYDAGVTYVPIEIMKFEKLPENKMAITVKNMGSQTTQKLLLIIWYDEDIVSMLELKERLNGGTSTKATLKRHPWGSNTTFYASSLSFK